MDPPPFRVHDGALHMAQKEVVKLGQDSDSQSSKKLKGKVLKAGDIGLDLAGGGRAPGYAHETAAWSARGLCIVLLQRGLFQHHRLRHNQPQFPCFVLLLCG